MVETSALLADMTENQGGNGMSRFNKYELQRICSCGATYFYSHYLRHGLCANCMAAAKQERLKESEVYA